MLDNLMTDESVAGSRECNPKSWEEELVAEMRNLGQRVQNLEQQISAREQPSYEQRQDWEKPKRKGIRWGKVKKFFGAVIKPILNFIPNVINAFANLKKVTVPAKS